MKINASIKRLAGAENNIQKRYFYLEVQDGLLETMGNILTRMSELKGLHSDDPLKRHLRKMLMPVSTAT